MPDNPAQNDQTDRNPAHHADEKDGKIKSRQLTDRDMPETDIARGAEGGAGRGGLGAQKSS